MLLAKLFALSGDVAQQLQRGEAVARSGEWHERFVSARYGKAGDGEVAAAEPIRCAAGPAVTIAGIRP